MSWNDGFLGARASRPHQAWHSLGHLRHLDQPATAPWLSFGLAHAVPAGRAVGCNIAGKLSGNRRDSMRAGRPRSRGCRPDGEVGGIRRATSLKAGLSPLGNSRLPASRAPTPRELGRSIEKDYKWNIDTQDAQDNQDGRLLQETRTRAMIACGFEDVREHKPAVSGKNPVHPVHRCESNSNLPMLDYEPVSSHQAQGVVSGKFGPRPAVRIIQGQNKRKSTIPSQPWHPVAVNLNALVALRRSSWPFVDNSFFFCFR